MYGERRGEKTKPFEIFPGPVAFGGARVGGGAGSGAGSPRELGPQVKATNAQLCTTSSKPLWSPVQSLLSTPSTPPTPTTKAVIASPSPFPLPQHCPRETFAQAQRGAHLTMESLGETTWDVIVCGTGLQQSLLALSVFACP